LLVIIMSFRLSAIAVAGLEEGPWGYLLDIASCIDLLVIGKNKRLSLLLKLPYLLF
jgi:hypothetical protein